MFSVLLLANAGAMAQAADDLFLRGTYRAVPYRLLQPAEIRAGHKYPLVIFLHGSGERGTDNEKQLNYITPLFLKHSHRQQWPTFVLAPQCPPDVWWTGPVRGTEMGPTLEKVMALVDSISMRQPIDMDRIYIMGLSMGGYGTWALLKALPNRFAAAVPICGGGLPDAVPSFRHVAIWVFHGAKDVVVPPDESRRMVTALRQAHANPRYTEYADVGHNSWDPAFAEPDLLPWLFGLSRQK